MADLETTNLQAISLKVHVFKPRVLIISLIIIVFIVALDILAMFCYFQ
jgi:hypothetical protein